jgi:streptomycin 6-kinase
VSVGLPASFLARAARCDSWAGWLAELPRQMNDICSEWQLAVDGQVMTGAAAAVLPVRTQDGDHAVLKLGWPHPEAEHEHLALRAWAGRGAVRLLRADPRRQVLLLERAEPGHDLHTLPILEACEVIAGLYPKLHGPTLPQLDRLSAHAERWADELVHLRRTQRVPRRFVDQAISLASDFASDPQTDAGLIHSDLHFANVLAAAREPWLAIDPKPLTGEPAYEVAPVLWNRWDEAVATGDIRAAVLRRMFTLIDHADLDEDRVRAWVVVREMVNVRETILGDEAGGPAQVEESVADAAWITTAMTIVKAAQR